MDNNKFKQQLTQEITELKSQNLFKNELIINSPQDIHLIANNRPMLNFCANNYLGLSNHPKLIEAATQALQDFGFGLSSVRFICGTQTIHKKLEQELCEFVETEDCILYSSCFDANGGLFETLFDANDAIISDELNHASIIDGIRLSKAKRYRFKHNNMQDLESQLQEAQKNQAKNIIIASDGVFSMDGTIANLTEICNLADKYQALVMIDDCHATGFLGKNGKGTHEHCDVLGRVDIITGTFGKALGGASGGFVCSSHEIICKLRQKSRPYLFSNSLAPMICSASLAALDLIKNEPLMRQKLKDNTDFFRKKLSQLGFDILPGIHPIVPIMIYDAKVAEQFSQKLIDLGIFAINFCYPVVPHGKARIRVQISSAQSNADLENAIEAFHTIGKELGVING